MKCILHFIAVPQQCLKVLTNCLDAQHTMLLIIHPFI